MSLMPFAGEPNERTPSRLEVAQAGRGQMKDRRRIEPRDKRKEEKPGGDQHPPDRDEKSEENLLELLAAEAPGEPAADAPNGKLKEQLQEVNAMVGIGSLFGDKTFQMLKSGLDGSTRAQQTIAHNLANIDTPGFLANRAEFKSGLEAASDGRQCSEDSDPSEEAFPGRESDPVTVLSSGEPPELDEELAKMTENAA